MRDPDRGADGQFGGKNVNAVESLEALAFREQLEVRRRKRDVTPNRRGGPSGGIGSCTSRTERLAVCMDSFYDGRVPRRRLRQSLPW
jgi:hypothetical protein